MVKNIAEQEARRAASAGPLEEEYPFVSGGGQIKLPNWANSEYRNHLCIYSTDTEDGRGVVFTAFDPIAGKGKELLRIPADPGGYNWMLSPDGSEVAFLNGPASPLRVQLISVRGRESRTIEVKGKYLGSSIIGWALDSMLRRLKSRLRARAARPPR